MEFENKNLTPKKIYGIIGRLIDEIKLHNYSYHTSKVYMKVVKRFHYSPEALDTLFMSAIYPDSHFERSSIFRFLANFLIAFPKQIKKVNIRFLGINLIKRPYPDYSKTSMDSKYTLRELVEPGSRGFIHLITSISTHDFCVTLCCMNI